MGTQNVTEGQRLAFADRLVASRRSRGVTQKRLGEETGIAKNQLSHYENGRNIPSAQNVAVLARALGVTTDHLISHLADRGV